MLNGSDYHFLKIGTHQRLNNVRYTNLVFEKAWVTEDGEYVILETNKQIPSSGNEIKYRLELKIIK